jgi:hypothetical protein
MPFNSHNNERLLGRTLRVVAAELIGLTQNSDTTVRTVRRMWYLIFGIRSKSCHFGGRVGCSSRKSGREILDCCRQREIYSLNALKIKVTLIAVDAGHCCARIPGSSIKFCIHMLLFWNLKI